MGARRSLAAVGIVVTALVVAAVAVAVVQHVALAPVNPVGDVARPTTPMPVARDQAVLDQVSVAAADLGPGWTARLIDQGDQLSQPTLDLCSGHYASESRRQARHQVEVSDSTGEAVMSTEAVLYQDQAGAAEAMAEVRGMASRCPGRVQVRAAADAGSGHPPGIDQVAWSVQAEVASQPMDRAVLVFLRRGRLLLGLYFLTADGPQARIAGTDTIAATVAVFQRRVADLPAAEVG